MAAFFHRLVSQAEPVFLSSITVGELRRGVESIRQRGDAAQAKLLEKWLLSVLTDWHDRILALDAEAAQVWGKLRVPQPEHDLDKQIAAIALVNDLTVVTRNVAHFKSTGARLLDPFVAA